MFHYKIIIETVDDEGSLAFCDRLNKTIGIGCDMTQSQFDNYNDKGDYYKRFKTISEIYEKDMDVILTHEYIHAAIDEVGEDDAFYGFCLVDVGRALTNIEYYGHSHPYFHHNR